MKKVSEKAKTQELLESLNGDSLNKIKGGETLITGSSTDRVCSGGCGSTRGWSQQ